MARRPVLKVGDVVRLSKKGLRTHRGQRDRFDTMVVHKIGGMDSSDGHCRVVCTYFDNNKAHRATFRRRDLWATGYNTLAGSQSTVQKMPVRVSSLSPKDLMGVPAAKPAQTNDGRTHCMSCIRPTTFIPGFGSGGYNICKNKSCKMFDT
jgi:hypothetical protein